MPDWLQDGLHSNVELAPVTLAVRLVLACLAGLLVAAICYAAHGRRKADAPMLLTTLVLLTVMIAMVTMVIGNSVARAFGLVGALSIVRFRTVVDDTRDTAFVIFAVIVGMAIGAGALMIPAIGIPLVGCVSILLDQIQGIVTSDRAVTHSVRIRLGLGRDPHPLFDDLLSRHSPRRVITSVATARQGAALDITYQLTIREETSLPQLVAELNQIEGVQSVELAASHE